HKLGEKKPLVLGITTCNKKKIIDKVLSFIFIIIRSVKNIIPYSNLFLSDWLLDFSCLERISSDVE
ncbi:hypothetical protein CGI36_22305, partial [Vibrio parahaemolyticus]